MWCSIGRSLSAQRQETRAHTGVGWEPWGLYNNTGTGWGMNETSLAPESVTVELVRGPGFQVTVLPTFVWL